MLQVKKIVGKLLSSNMYLLYEEGITDCYIIDIGDSSALAEALPDGMNVNGVFLTHSHFDHMAGINNLCQMFPECKVYTSEYGKDALYSDKKNLSLYNEQSVVYNGDNVEVLHDGDIVAIFEDAELYVMATPGHCPSCLTFYTANYVFSGDSYIPEVPVVTKLPKGNRALAEASKEKILKIAEDRKIMAGHDKDNWISMFQIMKTAYVIPLVGESDSSGTLGIAEVRIRFTNGMELIKNDGFVNE